MPRRKKGQAKPEPAKTEGTGPRTPGPQRLQTAGPIHPDDQPKQAGGGVTGPENVARQQQDPELDDTSGAHS
jgi:hypothetical protein